MIIIKNDYDIFDIDDGVKIIKILVAEDNEAINNLLVKYLTSQNYQVISFFDGEAAADYIEENCVDLALLDIMMPKLDGEELLHFFNQEKIPVIFLTAKDKLKDKIRGLSLGAEDYITKPFELEELLARIKVVLRHIEKQVFEHITWGNIQIEVSSQKTFLDDTPVSLTPKEIQLILFFIQNESILLTRSLIYQTIWEKNDVYGTRTVDLHIQRLRKKLHLERDLRTVYGVGYILEHNT